MIIELKHRSSDMSDVIPLECWYMLVCSCKKIVGKPGSYQHLPVGGAV